MIRCDSVSVQFGNDGSTVRGSADSAWALKDICISLASETMTALVGPSGCGKTTLLRVLAGLLNPTSGKVVFDRDLNPDLGELAFVFQRPALLPWLSAADNVRLPLDLLGHGSADDRNGMAMQMLQRVELDGEAAKYPHQLSGGMQMRVSIARALVTRPSVLLLDEPFSALDEVLRDQLGELLLSLWDEISFTGVMVTHNIAEAVKFSHRIVVMKRGHVSETIENDLPWPRTLGHQEQGLESDPRFGRLYSRVGMSLRREVTL